MRTINFTVHETNFTVPANNYFLLFPRKVGYLVPPQKN